MKSIKRALVINVCIYIYMNYNYSLVFIYLFTLTFDLHSKAYCCIYIANPNFIYKCKYIIIVIYK